MVVQHSRPSGQESRSLQVLLKEQLAFIPFWPLFPSHPGRPLDPGGPGGPRGPGGPGRPQSPGSPSRRSMLPGGPGGPGGPGHREEAKGSFSQRQACVLAAWELPQGSNLMVCRQGMEGIRKTRKSIVSEVKQRVGLVEFEKWCKWFVSGCWTK